MWKYILGPLLPAVIGWPWQLGHNEEHSFEENLTGVDPGGDTEPPSNNTHQKGDFWWFEGTIWGFWWSADGFGEDAPWFGTPESPGRLRSDGGWAGYFVDGIGVQAFGSWWPWVAYFVMITFLTGILGILTYSLHTLTGPCRALGRGVHALCGLCCCRRRDDLEAHLPSARPLMSEIEWHGPKTGWPTETRYLQQRLKGRGSRRRLNDVVVRRGGHVARLLQEESMLKRIDSDGLRVKFNGVSGCTSRQFRRELEEAGEVHLCRQLECRADHSMHIQEFAGVDHEALLDLHRYAHGSPRWLLGLLGRGLWRAVGLVARLTRCCCRICCVKKGTRVIRDEEGRERMLDPDSESEVEGDESSCQGVRIGLVIEGEMRPLAPDGCNDMATQEETTLLDEDIEVSDVRPPGPGQLARIPLCAHHRQVYQGAAAKRKCGVLTCHKASKGARRGVPLCYDHLCEQGGSGLRKDSPHPNGMLQGLRRRFVKRSTSRSRSPAPEQQPDGGGLEKRQDPGGVWNKKESGMAPMRSSSVDLGKVMIPSPPRGMLDEEDVMGKPVWMKIKLNYLEGQRECEWIMCMGELVGYTPGGVRGDRKLEIHVKYLETTIVVDPKYLEDMTEAKNVEEPDPLKAQLLINDIPQDAAGIGLDVKGYIVPEHLIQRLKSWEGRTIGSGRRLNQLQIDYVKKNISTLVRKHSAGFVNGEIWPSWPAEAELGLDVQVRGRAEAQPFGAREEPRKRSRSRSHSLARVMREEDEVKQKMEVDAAGDAEGDEMTGEGVVEAYATALASGQTHQEALDTIQMIFEVDFSAVQSILRNYIRRNCGKQNEQVEVAIRILKGAGASSYNVAKEETKPPTAQPDQPAPSEKRLQTTSDKLFPSHFGSVKDESSLIRPAGSSSTQNPLTVSDGVVGQLFGLGSKLDDTSTRAGAGGDEEDGQMGARVVHALEGLRKATEGDKKGNPGTRSAIGSEEGLDVYLARGCNTLTVEVCPDVTGKELFDALKRACSHAKAKLQQIEWPCLVTNGIAYGLAAMQHGGKDHTTLAPWQLSVAHAVTAKPRDFDQYEAPKDDKIEPKPRYPTHFATWLKQAKNEIKMIGSVLGLEHKKERLKALDQIERAHEQDSDVWPENYCYSLWEELKAAWVEELRESRRQLCRILNTDNPRKEDLKFVALAPDSGFHFPRTFDFAHPEGYYQQVCVPRQARALKGIIYGQLHHKRQHGGEGEHPGGEAGGDDDRVGRGRDRGGDKDKKKKEKERDEKKAYPAGKRLRPKEAAESVKHGPRTKEGKPICWDGATHMGCSRGKDCNHAHQPITTTKGLHWTVLAQLIRRGGLKSGPMIQPGQVDGRIAQLRAQAKAEQDEKVKDGGAQKQGWLPPEEYEGVQYTQLEDELRELTRGPDVNWLRDPMLDGGQKRHSTWEKRVEHPEAQRRLRVLESMEKAGVFARLSSWSSYLQSHVRGRMLNAVIEKQEMTIDDVLLEATEKGCPELAQEAEKVLSEERSVGWADDEKQAWISAPIWQKDKGYGEGKFEFQCGAERICWRYLDYKDKLPASDELASALGLQPGEDEERQCLVLHPAAGVLLWEGDWDPERRPGIEEVRHKAQEFRAALWDEAARAIAELGDPAPWISAREAEIRGYAHDCLRANHDKDYRLFQAFVIEELRDVTLQCWRLNCRGQFQVDHLVGSNPGSEGQIIPFLIHGGHIRLLVPNEKEEPVKVAAQLTLSGQTDREWQCEGWREFLANEDTAAPLVPGKPPKCPRCMDGNLKQGKAQPQVPWSFNEHPIDTQELILMGAQMPLKHRPSFAYGVRVQEMFAGSGTWTKAMGEAGPWQVATSKPRWSFQARTQRISGNLERPAQATVTSTS